ncbi:MAG: hypothetical protein AB7F79_06120 [Steroidobacteraceae bacterium]
MSAVAGKALTYGIVLNNKPMVEDLWNSTPVWGFPWGKPDASPSPAAAALIDGRLSQDVGGVGASLYRSAHLGSVAPSTDSQFTLNSAAPYLRLAWQHQWGDNSLEIGTYGIWANVLPERVRGQLIDTRIQQQISSTNGC